MCGRYTFYTDKELREIDDILEKIADDIARETLKTGEIFPTNVAPVLLGSPSGPDLLKWGFPNFRDKGVIINARAETARIKPMFRASAETRRCVIPSTGFFEWDRQKKKYLFNLPGSEVLYLAGLYNIFEGERRFVILTTAANASISDVHDRMPVILNKDELDTWLFDPHVTDDFLTRVPPALRRREA